MLHRSRWLTQSYCSFTVDDAPPTRNCLNRCGQHGQPHLFDIDSRVRVSIQRSVTAVAFPAALFECEVSIHSPAHMAGFAGRCPPVDFNDGSTSVAGHPLKGRHKLCESKVADLPSPQAFHPIEVEVFDTNDGVLAYKLICQLEEPIASAVADALVNTLQMLDSPPAVPAAFLAAGYRTVGSPQLFERNLIPLGRVYHRAVIQI